ncbi:Structural maintenance of chromosomes protein 3 [Intoshia linei]|uniref:Structural maintenance of chromosomes protein 3 n=1 Tax=Intoshia linei TaxID=1819745 RepID=A0A177BC55_9BILA|nr:Structural maintenance of chromosomes protein 3 [Intoshia linei]
MKINISYLRAFNIIIDGFKSYKNRIVVEPFDKHHNVVVGRNGSGKSNFFYAVQFVLSDEFSNLREEQRIALMYESADPNLQSASVDIIFDNTDMRLPIDSNEVIFRRVIGAKKDQYYVNKKLSSRIDCMNLLESAGLSKSNPYYIVKQGKINALALSQDSARLKLLHEIAGTKVYDQRKLESENILVQTENDLAKINEYLNQIDDKIEILNSDIYELNEYDRVLSSNSSLQFTVYSKELKEAESSFKELEGKASEYTTNLRCLNDDLKKSKQEKKEIESKLYNLKVDSRSMTDEKKIIMSEMERFIKIQTDLQNFRMDMLSEKEQNEKNQKLYKTEIVSLKDKIEIYKHKIEKVTPLYNEYKDSFETITRSLSNMEKEKCSLYEKSGRASQFESKQDRNKWIEKRLLSLNEELKRIDYEKDTTKKELDEINLILLNMEPKILKKKKEYKKYLDQVKNCENDVTILKQKRDTCFSSKNKLWRHQNLLQQKMSKFVQDQKQHEQSFKYNIGKVTLMGLDSIKTILKSGNYPGYQCTVIEALKCDSQFNTCVEMTAKKKLFNHIVDDDVTATKILAEMNKKSLPGECIFLPLNKLVVKKKSSDYIGIPHTTPLLNCLKFDEKYKLAFELIFGSTLISKDLDVAVQVSKTHDINCITLQGDSVKSSGSLTGGYFEQKHSKLRIYDNLKICGESITNLNNEIELAKNEINHADADLNNILNDLRNLEINFHNQKQNSEALKLELFNLENSLGASMKLKPLKDDFMKCLADRIVFIKNEIINFQDEMKLDLYHQLTHSENEHLTKLSQQIKEDTQKLDQIRSKKLEYQSKMSKYQNYLNDNLNKRLNEINNMSKSDSLESFENLKKVDLELNVANKNVTDSNILFKKVSGNIEEANQKLIEYEENLNNYFDKIENLELDIVNVVKFMETYESKKELITRKIETYKMNINKLNVSPGDVSDKYSGFSTKKLIKMLEECNQTIKKYSHLNRRATEEHVKFTAEKNKFIERKNNLDKSRQSIKELIFYLEEKKYNAIMLTFKQVSKYFSDIFSELVPNGKAILVMKKGEMSSEEQQKDILVEFVGIKIKVSFTKSGEEMRDLHQLSGGQKSLVALTLIFAIQKCDPAPFYLFDEIDQALDPQHRKAVADSIKDLSKKAQFITTTFRPELLEHATKFYGVNYNNKVSDISCIDQQQAHKFVIYDDKSEIAKMQYPEPDIPTVIRNDSNSTNQNFDLNNMKTITKRPAVNSLSLRFDIRSTVKYFNDTSMKKIFYDLLEYNQLEGDFCPIDSFLQTLTINKVKYDEGLLRIASIEFCDNFGNVNFTKFLAFIASCQNTPISSLNDISNFDDEKTKLERLFSLIDTSKCNYFTKYQIISTHMQINKNLDLDEIDKVFQKCSTKYGLINCHDYIGYYFSPYNQDYETEKTQTKKESPYYQTYEPKIQTEKLDASFNPVPDTEKFEIEKIPMQNEVTADFNMHNEIKKYSPYIQQFRMEEGWFDRFLKLAKSLQMMDVNNTGYLSYSILKPALLFYIFYYSINFIEIHLDQTISDAMHVSYTCRLIYFRRVNCYRLQTHHNLTEKLKKDNVNSVESAYYMYRFNEFKNKKKLNQPQNFIKLFVGQIPRNINEFQLSKLFSKFGKIYNLKILRSKETNQSKGCCFLTYYNNFSAIATMETLHDKFHFEGVNF